MTIWNSFHPSSQKWFKKNLGEPTAAQAQAWPAIQNGAHTLIAAPTGSGKTLAAFYAVIDALVQQGQKSALPDQTQIVYVSPLKALSNDIHRNLEIPLQGILQELTSEGFAPVNIRVAVRTGDTTPSERQQMLKNPPHILVTTPESLYLLLTSKGGRAMLKSARTLILDEIHALLDDKRGCHLSLSVERLEALTENPLQRIGLSATQKPIAEVARFLTGHAQDHPKQTHCTIIDTGHRRKLDLRLEVPESPLSAIMSNEVWEELYRRLVTLIAEHQTTLIFVNTRRLAERLARALSQHMGPEFVSSHHGSMSKEHRHRAEQRLKSGELKVLVATASMELGIDIGSVDLVVQFSSPKSIAALLQRVGRSGHSVGGTPKGIIFPLTRDDLVECTALLDSIHRGELDHLHIPEKPVDILAQQIVAEVASQDWDVKNLYQIFSQAYPYRNLTESEFSEILKMLSEGFTTRRGRRAAFLHWDRIHGKLRARPGARLSALMNGGAIPDMFDFNVVLDPENVIVGNLNEDFALESLPGDIFTLGNHSWQILRVDGLNVRVRDAQGQAPTVPFWLGEGMGRSQELSESVSRLRREIDEKLRDSEWSAAQWLQKEVGLEPSAAEQLVTYLAAGRNALEAMPTRECIIMERFFDEVGDMHLVIHSLFGSRVNKGWGLALRKRFCRQFNFELQAAANEDSIVISLGPVHSFSLPEVFKYLHTKTLRHVLIQALLDTPMFEVRWRWNASRALAVQRSRNGKRTPPQLQRMQSEDLIAQVFPDQLACAENLAGEREIPDHPLVQQTLHDCLTEALSISELEELIGKIERHEIQVVAKDLREPSPFAQEIINARPYAFLDDAPFEERRTNAIKNRRWLDPQEAAEFGQLDSEAIRRVQEEAWPQIENTEQLHEALMLSGFIKENEIHSDPSFLPRFEELVQNGRATAWLHSGDQYYVAAERIPQILKLGEGALQPVIPLPTWLQNEEVSPENALHEMLRSRFEVLGPVTEEKLVQDFQLPAHQIQPALLGLEKEGFIFRGRFTPGLHQEEWCERRLLQRIHKYSIESHRQSIQPVSLQDFMRFLFELHGVHEKKEGPEALRHSLELLEGYAAPAVSWEAELIPLRQQNYEPHHLDLLCVSGQLTWGRFQENKIQNLEKPRRGPVKNSAISLVFRRNLDLWKKFQPANSEIALSSKAEAIQRDLENFGASFFEEIQARTRLMPSHVEEGLSELVAIGLVNSDSFSGLRSLLAPSDRRRQLGNYGMEQAGRWSLIHPKSISEEILEDEFLERLIKIYLRRWGVLFRRILEKETSAPPWRLLLRPLRRMELRGELRGGRFISGVGGEQFAFPETVQALRQVAKKPKGGELVALSAVDPLNLLGSVLPGEKLARLTSNRILFRDGIPLAVHEFRENKFLQDVAQEEAWSLKQTLERRNYPPSLKRYLGHLKL